MLSSLLRTARSIGFTRGEATAILFLSFATLAGAIVRLTMPADAERLPTDEALRRHDSTFAARAEGGSLPPDAAHDTEPSEAAAAAAQEASPAASSGIRELAPRVVNLNTASRAQLETLPGVGPSTAERIIEYRTTVGVFRRIEDVMNVKSIGEKKFEKMKQYISVTD